MGPASSWALEPSASVLSICKTSGSGSPCGGIGLVVAGSLFFFSAPSAAEGGQYCGAVADLSGRYLGMPPGTKSLEEAARPLFFVSSSLVDRKQTEKKKQ